MYDPLLDSDPPEDLYRWENDQLNIQAFATTGRSGWALMWGLESFNAAVREPTGAAGGTPITARVRSA